MTKKTRNSSAAKKLVPAVAMLTTSAIMLSTATYAWFTMSKEVEVTGIQLTATTPELIEISFGTTSNAASATLQAPSTDADAEEWVHSAATGSIYSSFGKLMPASSIDGVHMFNTTDAIKFGREVNTAKDFEESSTAAEKTLKSNVKTTSTDAGIEADGTEGYYIDIPVWFRTTKTDDIKLGVIAKIQNPGKYKVEADTTDRTELYKAARVSVLAPAASTYTDVTADILASQIGTKVIMSNDASYYTNNRSGNASDQAVMGIGSSDAAWSEVYGNVAKATQVTYSGGKVTNPVDATVVATVNKRNGETNGYSTPTKYIIRVWLEGEDQACWNANAAQSFVVGLEFYDLSNC